MRTPRTDVAAATMPGAAAATEMPRRRDSTEEDSLAEVRSVYRDLSARPVERDCTLRTGCCHFKLTGKMPYLTRGEALLAARALKAGGRKTLPVRKDGACPLLDERTARCLIYEARPLGCRTHFCAAAGGPYARREVVDLIRRLEIIDEHLGGDGPRALPSAVAAVL
jgi:Fe-S-cluster containining protein